MPAPQPPLASTIRQSLPVVHYLDAYCVPLSAQYSATAVAQAVLQHPPQWVRALLRLRNAAVGWLGLRTSPASAVAGSRYRADGPQLGAVLGLFQVFAVAPTEVVLGLNDKHLDFRVTIMVEAATQQRATAWMCTAVQFHNLFGRAYFALVWPFHGLVVRAMLRAGQRRLAALPPLHTVTQ